MVPSDPSEGTKGNVRGLRPGDFAIGEESFQLLADEVADLVCTFDGAGNGEFQNRALSRFTGFDGGWDVARAAALVHPDERDRVLHEIRTACLNGSAYTSDLRLRRFDDERQAYRWFRVHLAPVRDATGGAVRWIGVAADIHDERTADEIRSEMRERDLMSIAQTIPQIVWRTDRDGCTDFFSPEWYGYTGLDEAQSLGKQSIAAVHPDDRERAADAWEAALRAGTPHETEFRLRGRDGSYRWFVIRARPLQDPDGSIVRWFGTCTDIDERRRAQAALYAVKARAALILAAEAAFDAFRDADRTLAEVARIAVREDFAEFCMFDTFRDGAAVRVAAVHGDPAWQSRFDRLYASPATFAPERSALEDGRTEFVTNIDDDWMRANAASDEHLILMRALEPCSAIAVTVRTRGNEYGMLTFGRSTRARWQFDLDDVATAEELARRAAVAIENTRLNELAQANERRAAAIADSVPQIFWTANADGWIDWYNRAWHDYTGQTPEEAAGWGWQAVHHPDDLGEVMERWPRSIATGEPFEMSFRLRGADGIFRWFLTRISPQRDAQGRVIKWFGTNTNVDAERRASMQFAFFARLGAALPASLELDETLDAAARLLVPGFADWASINLLDGDARIILAATHHRDPSIDRRLRGLIGRTSSAREFADGSAAVVASGRSAVFAGLAHDLAADAAHARIESIACESSLIVPLVSRGAVRGTLVATTCESGRKLTEDDLPFFEEVARRIVPAIDNAELFERERRIARTFQEAALPRTLPEIAGMRFDALYAAGRAEALIGGDFYDAVRLDDGRVVIAIGDVAGSGLDAATTMSEVRQAIRGAAAINADPTVLLDAADRVLRGRESTRFVTAWVGVVDPIDFSLSFASAGHPPPVLRGPDGRTEVLASGDLPLGLRLNAGASPTRSMHVTPGSYLALYTDGLTESTRDVIAGERSVYDAVAALPVTTARELHDRVLGDHAAHDDVAILVVDFVHRLVDDDGPLHPSVWRFDVQDAGSAERARRELVERLVDCRLRPHETLAAEVIFSELVANAYTHAGGQIIVVLDVGADIPVLHVLDRGPGFTFGARLPADTLAESGRGLYLAAHLARDLTVSRRPPPETGSHARAVLPGILRCSMIDRDPVSAVGAI